MNARGGISGQWCEGAYYGSGAPGDLAIRFFWEKRE